MSGTIIKIGKTITKTAEKIMLNATKGDINLNAAKSVVISSKKEITYNSYEAITPDTEEDLLVKKVKGPKEITVGKEYTFTAAVFSRKATPIELQSLKWAYKIDDQAIQFFKNPGTVIGGVVTKKIHICDSLWDNKTLKVYAYFQNPSDDNSFNANVLVMETMLIVGTEQHYSNSANKLMFAGQAVREVREKLKNHLFLEVLIFKDGYTEKQLSAFSKSILSFNKKSRITQIETTNQLINFINYGQREGKRSNHEHRKISSISAYAHGYVRSKTNEGVIAFGYEGVNANKQELDIDTFNKINKKVFLSNKQSHFYSYACRTGIGVASELVVDPLKENSLAQKMSNHSKIIVHAYMRRSLYEDTWGTQNHRDTYFSDNDKGSSVWENIKTDIKDAINEDPEDMNMFSKYITTEVIIDGAIWNIKGAYLPVKSGSFPQGVSSTYEIYKPN